VAVGAGKYEPAGRLFVQSIEYRHADNTFPYNGNQLAARLHSSFPQARRAQGCERGTGSLG